MLAAAVASSGPERLGGRVVIRQVALVVQEHDELVDRHEVVGALVVRVKREFPVERPVDVDGGDAAAWIGCVRPPPKKLSNSPFPAVVLYPRSVLAFVESVRNGLNVPVPAPTPPCPHRASLWVMVASSTVRLMKALPWLARATPLIASATRTANTLMATCGRLSKRAYASRCMLTPPARNQPASCSLPTASLRWRGQPSGDTAAVSHPRPAVAVTSLPIGATMPAGVRGAGECNPRYQSTRVRCINL